MDGKNKVFIATSLDGYIAGKNGEIDWLHSLPNPDNSDMGYNDFMSGTDALVMGRNTFETVCGFDMEWPYQKPVFVLSNSLASIPPAYRDKVELVRGELPDILQNLHQNGFRQLYIDGGKTIQSFLSEDLIDEMTITLVPFLLGEGIPLFSGLTKRLDFECVASRLFAGGAVQNVFRRNK